MKINEIFQAVNYQNSVQKIIFIQNIFAEFLKLYIIYVCMWNKRQRHVFISSSVLI